MHRAAKDTGKYQHFLHEPFANGALEHNAISLHRQRCLHTALPHCQVPRSFSQELGGVRVFRNLFSWFNQRNAPIDCFVYVSK